MNYNSVCVSFLKAELAKKQQRNSNFSMRAFAKLLGSSPGNVSQVLNEKRPLSLEKALDWSSKLGLEESDKEFFLDAAAKSEAERLSETEQIFRRASDKLVSKQLELDKFELVSEWYYIALLCLVQLHDTKADSLYIANKLDISEDMAKKAIELLERLGLIEISADKVKVISQSLETPSDIPSAAIRKYQKQNIERALESLEKDGIELRDITSMTLPVNSAKLKEVKKRIKAFKKELMVFLDDEDCDSVYSMNIQFFPQTKEESHV